MYTIEVLNGQNVTKICSTKLYVYHRSCNQKNYQFFLKVLLNCARDLLGLRWLCITLGCNAKLERPLLSKEIEGRKRQWKFWTKTDIALSNIVYTMRWPAHRFEKITAKPYCILYRMFSCIMWMTIGLCVLDCSIILRLNT